MEELKTLVSEGLTQFSSILLDPEFGLLASRARDEQCGLLLAYEKTGYDTSSTSRLPACLVEWSVKRLKEEGADAIKFLLYYDVDGDRYGTFKNMPILNAWVQNVRLKVYHSSWKF